jgi:16S rRNA (guanine966-N2)-methyltransferase
MSVKIIAGRYRGMPIDIPKSARPTLSRYRQVIFDMLAASAQNFFNEKIVLDCFAGSGALGIEAISRGAAYAYMVDNCKNAISAIGSNINKLGIAEQCTVILSDILRLQHFPQKRCCDIVFLDPPYFDENISIKGIVDYLRQYGWISEKTTVVIEQSSMTTDYIQNLEIFVLKKIGKSRFIIGSPR